MFPDDTTKAPPRCTIQAVMLPELRLAINYASDDILLTYARDAAIEVAKQTRMLKRVDEINVKAFETDYRPKNFAGEQSYWVENVTFNGCCMTRAKLCHGCRCSCGPHSFTFFEPDGIELNCAWHECDWSCPPRLRIDFVAVPTADACDFDCRLLNSGKHAIIAEVKAMMLGMKGRPWHDPIGQRDARKEADARIHSLSVASDRSHQGGFGRLPMKAI